MEKKLSSKIEIDVLFFFIGSKFLRSARAHNSLLSKAARGSRIKELVCPIKRSSAVDREFLYWYLFQLDRVCLAPTGEPTLRASVLRAILSGAYHAERQPSDQKRIRQFVLNYPEKIGECSLWLLGEPDVESNSAVIHLINEYEERSSNYFVDFDILESGDSFVPMLGRYVLAALRPDGSLSLDVQLIDFIFFHAMELAPPARALRGLFSPEDIAAVQAYCEYNRA